MISWISANLLCCYVQGQISAECLRSPFWWLITYARHERILYRDVEKANLSASLLRRVFWVLLNPRVWIEKWVLVSGVQRLFLLSGGKKEDSWHFRMMVPIKCEIISCHWWRSRYGQAKWAIFGILRRGHSMRCPLRTVVEDDER